MKTIKNVKLARSSQAVILVSLRPCSRHFMALSVSILKYMMAAFVGCCYRLYKHFLKISFEDCDSLNQTTVEQTVFAEP